MLSTALLHKDIAVVVDNNILLLSLPIPLSTHLHSLNIQVDTHHIQVRSLNMQVVLSSHSLVMLSSHNLLTLNSRLHTANSLRTLNNSHNMGSSSHNMVNKHNDEAVIPMVACDCKGRRVKMRSCIRFVERVIHVTIDKLDNLVGEISSYAKATKLKLGLYPPNLSLVYSLTFFVTTNLPRDSTSFYFLR